MSMSGAAEGSLEIAGNGHQLLSMEGFREDTEEVQEAIFGYVRGESRDFHR